MRCRLLQCLTDAERGTAIAVYNHSGESAALKSAHNMLDKRIAALQAENAALKELLIDLCNEQNKGDHEYTKAFQAVYAHLNGGAK